MLFNSINYIVFLFIVILLYFILPQKYRNLFLLIVSYFFYACWIPKYLILIVTTTILTYLTSILIDKSKIKKNKKLFLGIGIGINIIILFVFKYYDFFIDNINLILNSFNFTFKLKNTFSLILPVGISFYTFQSIGYCIDVYRNDVKCEYNFITYALFVSFFPQLVAGPIERSGNLIKQFYDKHKFTYDNTVDGLRYILNGMFRKIAIADLCAIIVNGVYNNIYNYSGLMIIIATFLFAIQIYCDFSGYSLIAIGSAKILGFNLMDNFKSPYFASSISEFWDRWHISLSTWFKDYIYIPLGGNRKGFIRKLINLAIVFLVSGLWHGAAWTFVLWGVLHAVYRVCEELIKKYLKKSNKENNIFIVRLIKSIFTFSLVCFAWIFFRANNINDALYVIKNLIGNFSIFGEVGAFNLLRNIINTDVLDLKVFRILFFTMIVINGLILFFEDFRQYKHNYNVVDFYTSLGKFRYLLYFVESISAIIFYLLLSTTYAESSQFIYFQF